MSEQPFETLYRDFVTDGVPSSGAHNPAKADLIDTFNAKIGATIVGRETVKTTDYTIVENDAGWTIVANSSDPITFVLPASGDDVQQFRVFNVGSGLLTLEGVGSDLVNGEAAIEFERYHGATVWNGGGAGAWRAILSVAGSVNGGEAGNYLPSFQTRAMAVAGQVDVSVGVVRLLCNRELEDWGGGRFRRVGSDPGHGGGFQMSDGSWWEVMEDQDITPQHFGAYGLKDPAAWATGTTYLVGAVRRNAASGSNSKGYRCTSNHVSGSTTEPGVGASWSSVWTPIDDTVAVNQAISWLYRGDGLTTRGTLHLRNTYWIDPTVGVLWKDTIQLVGYGADGQTQLIAKNSSIGSVVKRPWSAVTGGGYGRIRFPSIENVRVVTDPAGAQKGIDGSHAGRVRIRRNVITVQDRWREWSNAPTTYHSSSRGIELGVAETTEGGYVGGELPIVEDNKILYHNWLINIVGPLHGPKILNNDMLECKVGLVINHASSSNALFEGNSVQFSRGSPAASGIIDTKGYGGLFLKNYFERDAATYDIYFRTGARDNRGRFNGGFYGYSFATNAGTDGNTSEN